MMQSLSCASDCDVGASWLKHACVWVAAFTKCATSASRGILPTTMPASFQVVELTFLTLTSTEAGNVRQYDPLQPQNGHLHARSSALLMRLAYSQQLYGIGAWMPLHKQQGVDVVHSLLQVAL